METKAKLNVMLAIIIGIGFSLSSFGGWVLHEIEGNAISAEVKRVVDERAVSLHRELVINYETLQSLSILFHGMTEPSMDEFHNEAQQILSRHEDIQALEWVPRIKHTERDKYIAKIRKYYPNYEITQRKGPELMVRASKRDEYYPVYFVEPLLGNEAALGYDLSSSPERLKALQRSRDINVPQATASIELFQEGEYKKGFLAFLPIYKGQPLTLESRRENLVGFVLGVFKISDIFASSDALGKTSGINIELIDETVSKKEVVASNEDTGFKGVEAETEGFEVLYSTQSESTSASSNIISYRKSLPKLWGRKWSLVASPTVHYVGARRTYFPPVIFLMGFIFTAFISLYFNMISRRASIIEERVLEKTNELSEANRKLKLLSRSDGLTRIANRRLMDEILDKEWSRAVRNKREISFIFIDIDFFKNYNDNYGHLMGDECLIKIAATLKRVPSRATDLVARYGGEEFGIVLSETKDATKVAEACRKAIEELQITHEYSKAAKVVTISVGVCTAVPSSETSPRFLIDSADKALYRAKKQGRNRVEMLELDEGVHLAHSSVTELIPR